MMSATSWPRAASSPGSAPQTSARPPVLANGTASLATKRIFTAGYSFEAFSWGGTGGLSTSERREYAQLFVSHSVTHTAEQPAGATRPQNARSRDTQTYPTDYHKTNAKT